MIEILLQTSLPYILLLIVCANYCALYPKGPCVEYEVNMWYPCCMMSFVLEPSTLFYASCDSWLSLTLTLCSKNRKVRKRNENGNKIKKNQVHCLWTWQSSLYDLGNRYFSFSLFLIPAFLWTLELITSSVAPPSRRTSTIIYSCVSMLSKPIFTVTSLSMFPFKNTVYTWIKVHKFCMKFTEKVWKLKPERNMYVF